MSKWWRQRTFKLNKQKWAFEKGAWQPVLKEEHILREIVTRLWMEFRIKVYRVRERIPGMGAPSTPGIADLIGWTSTGLFLAIEVKRPGGVRRAAQEEFISAARQAGCIAFFAESWDDVVREFGEFGIKFDREVA